MRNPASEFYPRQCETWSGAGMACGSACLCHAMPILTATATPPRRTAPPLRRGDDAGLDGGTSPVVHDRSRRSRRGRRIDRLVIGVWIDQWFDVRLFPVIRREERDRGIAPARRPDAARANADRHQFLRRLEGGFGLRYGFAAADADALRIDALAFVLAGAGFHAGASAAAQPFSREHVAGRAERGDNPRLSRVDFPFVFEQHFQVEGPTGTRRGIAPRSRAPATRNC